MCCIYKMFDLMQIDIIDDMEKMSSRTIPVDVE